MWCRILTGWAPRWSATICAPGAGAEAPVSETSVNFLPSQSPTQKLQITRFFEGGATRLVGEICSTRMASRVQRSIKRSTRSSSAIRSPNEEEDVDAGPAGFVGLAHFIIDNQLGNVPPPPAPFVQTLALRAAAPVDDPVDTETVDTTPVDDTTPVVQRKAAAQVSAPAAQPGRSSTIPHPRRQLTRIRCLTRTTAATPTR